MYSIQYTVDQENREYAGIGGGSAAGMAAVGRGNLANGGDAAQQAAGTLWNLAANNTTNQDAIREAGGIPPLVALLQHGVA